MKMSLAILNVAILALAAGLAACTPAAMAAEEPASLKGKPAPEIASKLSMARTSSSQT